MNKSVCLTVALTLVTSTASAGDVSDKPQCQAGDLQCVHHVIQEMDRRFRQLTAACDHDAIFSLVYLRTTETYEATAPLLDYEDVSSVTREDALFADYYLRAYDAYHSGTGSVPLAWQIAFSAAESKALTAEGDAVLGINAHIQRDLPFTLYELYEQGHAVSEFDHFKVNEFLAQVEVSSELIERFDPSYPSGGDSNGIIFWRSVAWQNYLLLRDAQSEQERALVAAAIEQYAADQALYFASLTAYPPGQDSSARDAYCAENN